MSEQTPLLKETQPSAPPPPPPKDGAPPPQVGAPPEGPPPSYGTGQPQQQTAQVIIVPNQQVVVPGIAFNDVPVKLCCPNCHNDVTTTLVYTPGSLTWVVVLVLILIGCWLGCCLIPLCVDGVKDVDHLCPVCNYQIGKFKRM